MTRGTLGLVGTGAVGPALTFRLRAAGWRVGGVASRRLESARAAVRFVGAGDAGTVNAEAARGADLLLVTVPDRAIESVATEIAAAGTLRPGALAIHCSGALTSDALAPLRAGGVSVGSIHPLQSFADAATAAERIAGTCLFYEGDEPVRIRVVAEDLGGRPVPIRPEGKVLYHAGAAAACNLAVAMVDLGVRMMEAAGIARDDALTALLPLLEGTVANLGDVGLPAALTGPIARGDVSIVERHVTALRAAAPDLLAPYAAASLHAVRVGLAKGTLTPAAAEELRRILEPAL